MESDFMSVCLSACLQKEQNLAYSENDVIFFERQLDLYGRLCYVSCFYIIF